MHSKLFALSACAAVCMAIFAGTAFAYAPGDVLGELPANLFATEGDTLESMLDSTTIESQLGRAAADAVRLAAGSDIAVVNGGDLESNLRGGNVTWEQICSAFPEGRQLAVAEITPRELKSMLEAAVSRVVVDDGEHIDHDKSSNGAYPQISGFTFTYDISYLPGDRVRSIELDGESLALDDGERLITLAATEYMLSGGYDMPAEEHELLDLDLRRAFAAYVASGIPEPDNSPGNERITIHGTKDFQLFDRIPGATALVLALIGIIVLAELLRGERPAGRDELRNFRTE